MKKSIILLLIVVCGFIACESADEETTTMVPAPPSASQPVTTITDTTSVTPVIQAAPLPINMANAPKMNPAHGQPGHRCEIAVGAPLPQDGAQPVSAAQAQPPVQMNVPPPIPLMRAAPSTAGKVLNPAHGQPGHRCDISVGAPLPQDGSQPVSAAQAQPPVQMNVPPPTPLMRAAPTTAGKMLNPAHGQPGHRCEIAVGAPLN